MRANHSQNCGKGFARLEMMFISKLNLCKAELKEKSSLRASHSKDCGKGFARRKTEANFKLDLSPSDIKNEGEE